MFEFEQTKAREKGIFEAKMLGNNYALDTQLANKLITDMLMYFEKKQKKKGSDEFKKQMEQ